MSQIPIPLPSPRRPGLNATGGGKCLFARAKLSQWTAELRESTAAEKGGTLVKAGYLASVKTGERNVAGNLTFGGIEYLAARPTAVALDVIQSHLRSAATFGKMKPHEYRTIANTLNSGGLSAGASGIRNGIAQAVQLMKTGVDADPIHAQLKFELGETTFKNPVLDKVTKFIFNSLEAQDKPFYQFGFKTSLYGRARLRGIREGLKGSELSSRINELLVEPSEEMVLGAHADAQYVTFKNATALSDLAAAARTGVRTKLRNAPPGRKLGLSAASLAMDITIPFTKVASAILSAGVDYSPAGFAKAAIQAADKDPLVQAQLARALSRATLGTGLTMLGYSMAKNGTITGSAPTNPAQRKLWEAENKPANSVKIGGEWRSVTWLGPLAIPLLLGAGIHRFSSEGEEKTLGEYAGFTAGTIGKTMTEQSYMQGVSNMIGAMSDPTGRGASALAGMIPVPALVGQVATAIDPVARDAHGTLEKVQARIPFASKRLPAKVDVFGQEVKRGSGGIQGAAESLLDFTSPKTDASTPLLSELERLQVGVSGVGPSFTLRGKKYKRDADTLRSMTKEIGPGIRDELDKLIQSPRYKRVDDEAKEKLLRKAMLNVKQPVYKAEKRRALRDRIRERIQARTGA